MKRRILASVSLLFLLPAALHAGPIADENARLRQEVLDLKTHNAALEKACPVAAAAPAATMVAAPVAPPVAPAIQPVAPVAAAPVAAPPPPAPVAAVTAPAAAPKPYSSTGCERGYMAGPAPAKWQNAKAWRSLKKDMSGSEVEAALGVDHYDVDRSGGRVVWQYGRCHSSWAGDVTLFNGVLESFNTPDQ